MLDDDGYSKKNWEFAVQVVVYFKNCTPTCSVDGKTPSEARHGSRKRPSLKHLRVFACFTFVHVLKMQGMKLDYRATPGKFIQ
jgi:hypothetical protein